MGQDPDDPREYSPPPAIRLDDVDDVDGFVGREIGADREFGADRDFRADREFGAARDFGGSDFVVDSDLDADRNFVVDRLSDGRPRDAELPSFTRGSGGTVTTFLPKEPPGASRPSARFGEVRMPKQPDAELDELLADLTDGPKRRSRGPGQHSASDDEPAMAQPEQRVTDPRVFPWALLLVALVSAGLAATAIIMALA